MFLMSDILTTIRSLAVNELGDLGDSDATQNDAIFRFTTVVLRKRARQAYLVETSDTLSVSTGYQAFVKGSASITDMYEPLAIYDSTDSITNKRSSWDHPMGWFKESENQKFHFRGMNETCYLKYLRYPKAVTASTDQVEFPLASQMDIIMDVVALCKLPKNYYDESNAIKAKATGTATEKATIAARGTTNWSPPSLTDKED